MENRPTHSLCLKITLVQHKIPDECKSASNINYPSKIWVIIKKECTVSDLCREIEGNVQSMGYNYLHIQYVSTNDMFRLSPNVILNEIVSNNSDLIATYSVHYTNDNCNDMLSFQSILQDWKRDLLNNMTQCYQIMKEYDSNQIEKMILNLNENKNDSNISNINIDMNDLIIYTVFLCSMNMNNVELQSKAIQLSYCILNVIINKQLWTPHNKASIEYILHQLICSDYIDDDQRINLLNIGNECTNTECMDPSEKVSSMDSIKTLKIDTDAVIFKVKNGNKIIKSVLHNALLSDDINSNSTNTLISIMNNPISKDRLKYRDILKYCHYITAYHYKYINTNKNKNSQHSDEYKRAIINVNHIAEIFITQLVEELEGVLFCDNKHNEKKVHGFLDLLTDDKLPQCWREFRVIVTGIDVIWKHLTHIISPTVNKSLNIDSMILVRLRVHLVSVMFALLENCDINQTEQIPFQHSHFGLLQQFILKWINDTNDAVEFCQIIANKNIDDIISWPINIQEAYFGKILLTCFLHQTYKSIETALNIIKYVIKYPILLNDDCTAEIANVETHTETLHSTRIHFNFKRIYLQMLQKGLRNPNQKSKIIEQFTGVLLNRLRFATYSKEQILLLRLLCLFNKNCKNQFRKDQIIRNVKHIYQDGKLANLTTQSYVDLLLQTDSMTHSPSVSKSQSEFKHGLFN